MNAVAATAFGDAGSWNRSSQADIADGDGTAGRRIRRQRACNDRRSARGNNARSIFRSTAAKPLSGSLIFQDQRGTRDFSVLDYG
jgi:hypothetical protein